MAVKQGGLFKGLSSVISSIAYCALPTPTTKSLMPLWMRGRSARPASGDPFTILVSLRAVCSLLGNPRYLQTDLQRQLPAPTLHTPKSKHSRCQRATEACNEKQVSPRDLSATAVRQLGSPPQGQGRGGGTAGLTPSVQLPGLGIGCSSPSFCYRRL